MSAVTEVRTPLDKVTGTTVAIAVNELKLRQALVEALRTAPVDVTEENCPAAEMDELLTSIEKLRPQILLLGVQGLQSDPAKALARIAVLESAPRVVVVNDSAEPELILQVMRAGAAEFVYPPFGNGFDESMRRTIAECLRVSRDGRAMGTVIGFVSAKGGCGATTLACHTSAHLQRATKKEILLADLDMTAGIAGVLMQANSRYSLDDGLQHLHRMDLKLWKALVTQAPCGVDVIPASPEPVGNSLSTSRKFPQMLRFWRAHYDLSILDLGHGMNPGLSDVLDSIDTLVLVANHELPALRQAKKMIHSLAARNFGANRLKLVINRVAKRTQIQIPELEKIMDHPVYFAIPDDSQALSEAWSESRLVAPQAQLAVRIGAFTEKLTGIAPEKKKARTFFGFRREK